MDHLFENRSIAEHDLAKNGWARSDTNPKRFINRNGTEQAVILSAPDHPGDVVQVRSWPVPQDASALGYRIEKIEEGE